MNVMMFVEVSDRPWGCGFQLSSRVFYRVPPGRIRIARYNESFCPLEGRGYYADTYLRAFVRKWKEVTVIRKRRISERRSALQALSKTCFVDDIILRVAEQL